MSGGESGERSHYSPHLNAVNPLGSRWEDQHLACGQPSSKAEQGDPPLKGQEITGKVKSTFLRDRLSYDRLSYDQGQVMGIPVRQSLLNSNSIKVDLYGGLP